MASIMNCLAIVLAPISPHLTLMPRLPFLQACFVCGDPGRSFP
jgi:hypothetical protein